MFSEVVEQSLKTILNTDSNQERCESFSNEESNSTAKVQPCTASDSPESNLKKNIDDVLDDKEINYKNVSKTLVGFGADGASVNLCKKESVKSFLIKGCPWLLIGWCLGYRLELSVAGAFRKTRFEVINDTLVHVYYLYKKSPKKLSELEEIYKNLKEEMLFAEPGVTPKKVNGTGWISHKVSGIKRLLDKWGIYISHLKQMKEDTSYNIISKAGTVLVSLYSWLSSLTFLISLENCL